MSIRPYRDIYRRRSRQINVGSVAVGGDAPISVQSMTNTPTTDVDATIAQVRDLEVAGADIVRISCPDQGSTEALAKIIPEVTVPIVADIHFHYKRAIEAAEAGAACLRINPGNIGSAERVREVVKAAKDHGCSMRIGVNAGSLERELLEKYGEPCPEAMIESALNHIRILEEVKVGFDILKSLGLRHRGVNVISCPSCARQQFAVIETVERLEQRLAHITTPMTVSVIGCVVNGPGEATMTDIGLTGGGKGTHQVYLAGVAHHRLKDADIVDHLVEMIEAKAAEIEAQADETPAPVRSKAS